MCTRGKETKLVSINRYIRFIEIFSGFIKNREFQSIHSNSLKKTYNQHQLLILFCWRRTCQKITRTPLISWILWTRSNRDSISIRYLISLRSINSLRELTRLFSPGYWTGSLNVLWLGWENNLYSYRFIRIHQFLCQFILFPKKLKNPETIPENLS